MKPRGVFFDLYGTLLVYNDMEAAWDRWRGDLWSALSPCGLRLDRAAFDRLCDGFFESPAPDGADALTVYERRLLRLCREAELEPGPATLRRLAELSIAGWQRHIPLDPDAPKVLRALK